MRSEKTIEAPEDKFAEEVLEAEKPVLAYFWLPRSGPCHVMHPLVAEIAKRYKNKLKVVKVDVYKDTKLPSFYEILAVPTFIIFKKGKPAGTHTGACSQKELIDFVEKVVG
ncbi:MAG: thioredoxin [Firmicutes bacterium]|nr:thioredoxin [Bacillota bacterium]